MPVSCSTLSLLHQHVRRWSLQNISKSGWPPFNRWSKQRHTLRASLTGITPVTHIHALFLAVPPKRNLRFRRCLGNGGGVSYALAESLDFATPKKCERSLRFRGSALAEPAWWWLWSLVCYFCTEFWCCLVAVWYSVFILFFFANELYVLEISQTILHRYEWIIGEGIRLPTHWPRSRTISNSLLLSPSKTSTRVCNTRTATIPGSSRVLCHTITATAGIHAVAGSMMDHGAGNDTVL